MQLPRLFAHNLVRNLDRPRIQAFYAFQNGIEYVVALEMRLGREALYDLAE